MRRLVISPGARRAYVGILRASLDSFGEDAATRYRWLMQQAFLDLQTDPQRVGVRSAGRLDLHLYHVRSSRDAPPKGERVRRPRHLLVFRYDEDRVEIMRIYHDSMDFRSRIKSIRR